MHGEHPEDDAKEVPIWDRDRRTAASPASEETLFGDQHRLASDPEPEEGSREDQDNKRS